jgi:hypothetical protein
MSRAYSLTSDLAELQRRAQEALCFACAQPLPEDAAVHRAYCDATCRKRQHRFENGA